jgi:putative thioredoxin
MASSDAVVDIDLKNFEEEVVEKSKQVPVVVDFWAPWCAPCRQLGPVLEQLARESNGGFVLAKVNVDDNQDLAAEFGVNGIPAVFALKDASVVDSFVGALPRSELEKFIARLSPSEADNQLAEAKKLEAEDASASEAIYRELFEADPHAEAVRVGLARVLLSKAGEVEEPAGLLHGIESGEWAEEAERLRKIVTLREIPHSVGDLRVAETNALSGSAESLFAYGQILAAVGQYHTALETLIQAATEDKKLASGPIRELMVTIFHIIGMRSEMADNYRDKLRSLLY